ERQLDASAFYAAFEVALFGRVRQTGPIFSAVISVELQAPDVEPDIILGSDAALGSLPDVMPDASAFEVPSSTTLPGKLGPPPAGAAGRRMHSMWSMSL